MKLILWSILVLGNLGAFAQETVSLKIGDIKNLVETRNERVSSKAHQITAMELRQGYLKRSFLPSLKIYGAQERFQLGNTYRRTQPTYGAEISLNLFNGTKDKLQDDIADKQKERIGSEKRITLYHEIIKAKEIYWNLVYLKNALVILNETRDINLENLKSAQKRIKAGVTTAVDRLEFEIKDTEIKRGIDQTHMQQKLLERELVALLGYAEGSKISITDQLVHLDKMENFNNHSEIQHQFLAKASFAEAEVNQIAAKMQERSWWPRVDAYLAQNQYNVRTGNIFDIQEGKEIVAGVRLTMNLFDFTSGNREAAALKSEAEGSKSEAKYLVKQTENEAHSEIASLEFLHRQIHDAEENIKRAQGYFRMTKSGYTRGVKDSSDVLGSVDKLFEMKTKYYEILRDFYITRDHLRTKGEI